MSDQELNMKLVEAVEKHDVLYNYKLPGYSRRDVTEKAWKEVSIELDLPVQDCKDKWRNLRTVFMRRMKPSPSGSGAKKKAYYLENAMQFCLPFIKTTIPPSTGNLPKPPSITHPSIDNSESFEAEAEEDLTQLEDEFINVQQNSPSMYCSIVDESPQPQIVSPPENSSSQRISQITKKRKNNSSASEADQSVAEYFKTKRAKLLSNTTADTCNQKIDRQQGIKMFLLSLIPELEELSDSQIKIFKRQVLRVIDDISAPEHHQQPRPSSGLTMLTSSSMSNSRDSKMDETHMSNIVGQMNTTDLYGAFC